MCTAVVLSPFHTPLVGCPLRHTSLEYVFFFFLILNNLRYYIPLAPSADNSSICTLP